MSTADFVLVLTLWFMDGVVCKDIGQNHFLFKTGHSPLISQVAHHVSTQLHTYTCWMDVLLVEYMYLVFTRMPCESYRRRLRSLLLCLCDVYRALIYSLVC